MNEQLSRHHHYIPVFFIKKFAGEEKKMWVYNKETKRFDKNQKSPKGMFYKDGRNLSEFKGKEVDQLERLYGEVDNALSVVLDRVLSTEQMSQYDLEQLIYLVSLMKWRVPKADSLAEDILSSLNLRDLGGALRSKDTSMKVDLKELEAIENLSIMKDLKRFLLSSTIAFNSTEFAKAYKSSYIIEHFGSPSLLGDCITIEKENNDINKLNDFVFPLSDTRTLISKNGCLKQNPHPIFPEWKDLAIFHLSERKVACKDRSYLEKIIKTYDILLAKGKTDRLIHYIFDLIP